MMLISENNPYAFSENDGIAWIDLLGMSKIKWPLLPNDVPFPSHIPLPERIRQYATIPDKLIHAADGIIDIIRRSPIFVFYYNAERSIRVAKEVKDEFIRLNMRYKCYPQLRPENIDPFLAFDVPMEQLVMLTILCPPSNIEDYDGVLDGSQKSWTIAHRIMGCRLRQEGVDRNFVMLLNVGWEVLEGIKGEQLKFINKNYLMLNPIIEMVRSKIRYEEDTAADMEAIMQGYDNGGQRCYERYIPHECFE
jgi:hypothetical protein